MNNKTITVLTPTYNRGDNLKKLYESLLEQTNNDFCWVIVDDGSNDNTESLVKEWIFQKKIDIKYYSQENGGKHRALNFGLKNIKSELTFIVDSDDYITSDAIETIIFYNDKYKNLKLENICGFSFYKANNDYIINGKKYSRDEFVSDYISYRLNKHIDGDKAEVFYTNILKKYPFPEFDNEKFLSEGYVWTKIALDYDTVYISKIIYIAEYLSDGLTKNIMKRMCESPKGVMANWNSKITPKSNLYVKVKSIIKYIAFSKVAGYSFSKAIKECNSKFLFVVFYIVGYFYFALNLKKYIIREMK